MNTKCKDPKGNKICTNGIDTYHNFNMNKFGGCNFCSPTEPKKTVEKYRCEVCDAFECNCFCKCGLPHDQCVCGFKPEDFTLTKPIIDTNFLQVKVNFTPIQIGNDERMQEARKHKEYSEAIYEEGLVNFVDNKVQKAVLQERESLYKKIKTLEEYFSTEVPDALIRKLDITTYLLDNKQ